MDRFMREVARTLIGAYPWRPSNGSARFLPPLLLNRAGARIATAFSEEVRPARRQLADWRVLAALREQTASAWAICPAPPRSRFHADPPGRQHGAQGPGRPPPRRRGCTRHPAACPRGRPAPHPAHPGRSPSATSGGPRRLQCRRSRKPEAALRRLYANMDGLETRRSSSCRSAGRVAVRTRAVYMQLNARRMADGWCERLARTDPWPA